MTPLKQNDCSARTEQWPLALSSFMSEVLRSLPLGASSRHVRDRGGGVFAPVDPYQHARRPHFIAPSKCSGGPLPPFSSPLAPSRPQLAETVAISNAGTS
eukprot:CAMPEP_0182829004 /NCGR_PEP_ID=MMETSP0006_2-20121128/17780_1 /TAXON_ID=97485 /ORGANISM="Prymnesium parvum, Strain Texoma1" /LENGTH=99 /DNA_ID=CAMNT_0024956415 /DNA_START=49 /DNA_END=345 /DNA_ORIENTATION=-